MSNGDDFSWGSLEGISDTAQDLINTADDLSGDLDAILKKKDEVVGRIQAGQATLQDLGLLPAPPGQPEGGRWVYEERTKETAYYPPGANWHGHPIEEWPEWIPLGAASSVPFILGDLYFRYNVSFDDVKKIGEMNPISGIASPGTGLDELTPMQKRAFIANSYAIAAAKYLANSGAYNSASGALKQQQDSLGFAKPGTCAIAPRDPSNPEQDMRLTYSGPPVCTDTGAIRGLDLGDKMVAAERLYAVLRGLSVPDVGLQTTAPVIPTTGPGTECFGLSKEDCAACIKDHKEPGVSELLDVCYRPYLATHTPGKLLEYVIGPDKKGYLVLEMGGKVHGIRLLTAALTGGALAVGGITAGGYYLFKTKRGKRLARRLGLI